MSNNVSFVFAWQFLGNVMLTKHWSLVPDRAVNYNTRNNRGRELLQDSQNSILIMLNAFCDADITNNALMYSSSRNDIFMSLGFIGGSARVKACFIIFLE